MSIDVLKELENSFYNCSVLYKIKNKLQLQIDDSSEALKLLEKNKFSLAKEVVLNNHYSIVCNISNQSIFENKLIKKVLDNPGTIKLNRVSSDEMTNLISHNYGYLKVLFMSRILKRFGSDSSLYKLISLKLELNKEEPLLVFYHLVRLFEEKLKENSVYQQTIMIPDSFFSNYKKVKYKTVFSLKFKSNKYLEYSYSKEIFEEICKAYLINVVYYKETEKNSHWLKFIGSLTTGNEKTFNNIKKEDNWSIKPKINNLGSTLSRNYYRCKRVSKDFSFFKTIPVEYYQIIWKHKSSRSAVLKSDECNYFLGELYRQKCIKKEELIDSLNFEKEIVHRDVFFTALKEKGGILKGDFKVSNLELFKEDDLVFFEFCLKESLYKEEVNSEENASFINHLIVNKDFKKLEILIKYNYFKLKIEDEDGDSPEVVLKKVLDGNLTNFEIEKFNKIFGFKKESSKKMSSGSLCLDFALGGGYPVGNIVEICGPESSGKTTLALSMIREQQKNGKICALIDIDNSIDHNYAKDIGVKTDELLISSPISGEEAFDVINNLIETSGVDLIIVDNIYNIVPKVKIEGGMVKPQVGIKARIMAKGIRKVATLAKEKSCTVIFINKIKTEVTSLFGAQDYEPLGNSLRFYSSQRIRMQLINFDDVGGNFNVKIAVKKNLFSDPFKTVEIPFLKSKGVDVIGDIIDVAKIVFKGVLGKEDGPLKFYGDHLYIYDIGLERDKFSSNRKETINKLTQSPHVLEYIKGLIDKKVKQN